MTCPKCGESMESVTFKAIQVDRCSGCRGIWFDTMERERLAEREDSEQIDDGDSAVGKQFDAFDRIDCPRCRMPMIRMVDARQPHIRYESCKVCYGAFLDAGEFRDLRERTLLDFLRDLVSGQRS